MSHRTSSPSAVAKEIRRALKRGGSREHAKGVQWFFKQEVKSHGWYSALRRESVWQRKLILYQHGLIQRWRSFAFTEIGVPGAKFWTGIQSPDCAWAPNDSGRIIINEQHIRQLSMSDISVPPSSRGPKTCNSPTRLVAARADGLAPLCRRVRNAPSRQPATLAAFVSALRRQQLAKHCFRCDRRCGSSDDACGFW